MSLVAYGTSDESEEESDDFAHVHNVVEQNTSNALVGFSSSLEENGECSSKPARPMQSLFQSLPKPKQNICESIDLDVDKHPDMDLLSFHHVSQSSSKPNLFPLGSSKDFNKKVGLGPVKITLPSLSEFNDEKEDEPVKKKLKPSQKGSGLFAILPAPKNMRSRETQQPLVPYVLTKRVGLSSTLPIQSKKTVVQVIFPEAGNESEDDEEKDFFSLNLVNNVSKGIINTDSSLMTRPTHNFSPGIEHKSDTVTSVYSSSEEPLAFHSGFLPSTWANELPLPGPSREEHRPTNCPSTSNERKEQSTTLESSSLFPQENLQLDAEAMQRLCGRRSKKHSEPVEFIDVNGKEIMPDPNDWLVKQLSEEQPKMRSHSHKRNDGPTTQQRRKHQITYLAFQAKENELELKNQWSQNRMSRKQTQSKYGF